MTRREAVNALAYRVGWKVARHLPQKVVDAGLNRLADRSWRRGGPGVRRLQSNLARAAGTFDPEVIDTLSRGAMRSYLRYWGEVFRLSRWDADQIRAGVIADDFHVLRDAYDAGNGVVAALPHMGNWELAGAWSCMHGIPLTTVAERLEPEGLYEEFVAFRRGLGMEVLALTGGPPTTPILLDRLHAGGFVCLLADRDLSRGGVEVELLGEPARLPSGPALLAQRTGAALLPITTHYVGDRMRIRFFDPIAHQPGSDGLIAMTRDVAAAFTTAIRDDPVDWHMLQKVFVRDLVPARRGRR